MCSRRRRSCNKHPKTNGALHLTTMGKRSGSRSKPTKAQNTDDYHPRSISRYLLSSMLIYLAEPRPLRQNDGTRYLHCITPISPSFCVGLRDWITNGVLMQCGFHSGEKADPNGGETVCRCKLHVHVLHQIDPPEKCSDQGQTT